MLKEMWKKERSALVSKIVLLSAGLMAVILVCSIGIVDSLRKNVVIIDGEDRIEISTLGSSVRRVLSGNSIRIQEGDEVAPGLYDVVIEGMEITILRGKEILFSVDGEVNPVRTAKATVGDFIDSKKIELGDADALSDGFETPLFEGMELTLTRNAPTQITETVEIGFESKKRTSTRLNDGEEKEIQEGKNGERVDTYQVRYENGVVVERVLLSQEVTKKPVDAIIERGTSVQLASRGGGVTRDSISYSKVYDMVATAYDPSVGDRTATGIRPYRGVVAVDPKVIPLGTRLFVETADGSFVYGSAVAADTGGAIKGAKIDLFMGSKSEAIQFGRRNVKVYILD